MVIASSVFLTAMLFWSAPAHAAGEFKVSNYGSGSQVGNYFYRGYRFQVSTTTVVTDLIGGATEAGFAIGLYSIDMDVGNYRPSAVLGSVETTVAGEEQVLPLGTNVTLEPGNDYILAQGRNTGTGEHYYVQNLNVPDLLAGSVRIDLWEPETNNSIRWSGSGPANHIVGSDFLDFNGAMPKLGFLYESTVTSAVITTEANTIIGDTIELEGTVTETGGGLVSQYIEWGTEADLSDGTLVYVSDTTNSNSTFSVNITPDGGNTIYYRAVGINDAGRSEGSISSFTPYKITYTAGSNGSLDGTDTQYVYENGTSTTITAVADEGHSFTEWSDDFTEAERTDSGVTSNILATAEFAINVYTLEYVAGNGGTLIGSTTQMIDHGTTATSVEAVSDAGYEFTQWSDGRTENPRTDSNVRSDMTVTAQFRSTAATQSGSAANQARGLESSGDHAGAARVRDQYPNAFPDATEEVSNESDQRSSMKKQIEELQSHIEELRSMLPVNSDQEASRSTFTSDPLTLQVRSELDVPAGLPVRDLSRGVSGQDVQQLQRILNQAGFTLTNSGAGAPNEETTFFGTRTQDALAAFQAEHDVVPAQGYFGPFTRASMSSLGLDGLWW